jgi:hypothetical protein
MYLDPDFAPSLADLSLEALEESQDVVYVLDREYRLRGYNSAWVQFARVNDGSDVIDRFPLGCDVMAVIDESLQPFYRRGYGLALECRDRFDCEYECSSPDVFRLYVQSAYPLGDGSGLLITNHCRLEEPFPPDAGVCFGPRHVDDNGNIIQCCHCRKIRDHSATEKWDWIPELIRQPRKEISHSLCLHCLHFYYPAQD